MSDTITLPRFVVQEAAEALEFAERNHGGVYTQEIANIRTALAAEQPKPSEEAEALRRDAERYRYLRNRDPVEVLSKEGKDAGCWIDCEEKGGIAYKLQLLTGDDADAAIDAAMGDKT